ncbi:unnamed protein product [Pedinophyceae sp. YPF-701]|nr:unnamed protein product [Pedinophyceae sp. YPF-701]
MDVLRQIQPDYYRAVAQNPALLHDPQVQQHIVGAVQQFTIQRAMHVQQELNQHKDRANHIRAANQAMRPAQPGVFNRAKRRKRGDDSESDGGADSDDSAEEAFVKRVRSGQTRSRRRGRDDLSDEDAPLDPEVAAAARDVALSEGPVDLRYLRGVDAGLLTQTAGDRGHAVTEWTCTACGGDDVEGTVVQCDGCDAAVHLACYGLTDADVQGDWYCDACAAQLDPARCQCVVCPVRRGALRRVVEWGACRWGDAEEGVRREKEAEEAAKQRLDRKHAAQDPAANETQAVLESLAAGGAAAGDAGAKPKAKRGRPTKEDIRQRQALADEAERLKRLAERPTGPSMRVVLNKLGDADVGERRFCHVACARWLDGVEFADPAKLSGVRLTGLSKEQLDLRCAACGQRGGAVQCCVRSCVNAFHATCGMFRGHVLAQRSTDGAPLAFCYKHSDDRYEQLRGDYISGAKRLWHEDAPAAAAGGAASDAVDLRRDAAKRVRQVYAVLASRETA